MIFTALAAATIVATCPWQDRGLDRFMGDIPAAVDTYTDIPKTTRLKLQEKMRGLKYDDITLGGANELPFCGADRPHRTQRAQCSKLPLKAEFLVNLP